MRLLILTWCCCFLGQTPLGGQNTYQGQVKDKSDGSALAYCAVAIKGLNQACLSNEDGYFRLRFNPSTDTLVFQALGYKTLRIPASQFLLATLVFLEPEAKKLEEVTVYANNDVCYQLIETARKKLSEFKENESKAYYSLQSNLNQQPVELLECYYNARFTNARVKELNFKNGRAGIATANGRYFVNLDISRVFTYLDLINGYEKLPANPFQFSKKQLKKHYRIELVEKTNSPAGMWVLKFVPKQDSARFFKGKVWIDEQTGHLIRIDLEIEQTAFHPFMPAYEGLSKIGSASFHIQKTYRIVDQEARVDLIRFDYELNYRHLHQDMLRHHNPDTSFVVNSRGLLYFYDYDNPFILPRFEYDSDFSDYRKIVSLGYNVNFWQHNFQLMYSKRLQKQLQYFNRHGKLLNFSEALNLKTDKAQEFMFADSYIPWSAGKRVSLKKNSIRNDTTQISAIPAQAYQLKAQIFLDLNTSGDSLTHYSTTLFDVFGSYYNLKEEAYTSCFLNIFFDLCEIERRKLEGDLKGKKTLADIDRCYTGHRSAWETTAAAYFREVERGKNKTALKRWNDKVLDELAIDNMKMFGIEP